MLMPHGRMDRTKPKLSSVMALCAHTLCLPQCLQSAHGTYVIVLPVSMMSSNLRGGVPISSVA
jgi:hypothetical protein